MTDVFQMLWNAAVSVGLLVTAILVGAFALVAVILMIVFSAVRRSIERAAAELASEGIDLDSGLVPMKVRFHGFRGPRVAIGVGVRAGRGRAVLTKRRLAFLPLQQSRYGIASIERSALARFDVGVDDGRLHVHTSDPPNASGTVDFFLAVSDPNAWVAALTAAGAKPR